MKSGRAGIRLFFLGSPQVIDATTRQISLHGRKTMALLAYIVSNAPKIQARRKLAALFWPDLSIKDAHNNLRVTLARNSANLGVADEPYVLADRQSVQLNPRANLWCDITELRRRSAALPVEFASVERFDEDPLMAGLQGEFLAGLSLDSCHEFEQWLLETREHTRVMATRLVDQLADHHQRKGRLRIAEALTRRLLEIDYLYEPAHRRLMLLLAQQDLRHIAMEHFEHVRKILNAELGISPDANTVALLAAIEAGKVCPMSACPPPAAEPQAL